MTTVSELLNHDFMENGHIHHRYWKASSLPIGERHKARPMPRKHRRDRMMKAILRRDMRCLIGRKVKLLQELSAAGITVKGEEDEANANDS